MSAIEHIVEPEKLLLAWQVVDEDSADRVRRIVGELCREPRGCVLRYFSDADDFKVAAGAGFKGFPSFDTKKSEHREGVMDAFLRRIPSRTRDDFREYLNSQSLPSPFNYSDFALLGYTGARLPSDGFMLLPVFPEGKIPCEFITEVSGLRHVFKGDFKDIHIGDEVTLQVDSGNTVDADAVKFLWNGVHVGFLNRGLRGMVKNWMDSHNVTATVHRINGKPQRPMVYLRISVT